MIRAAATGLIKNAATGIRNHAEQLAAPLTSLSDGKLTIRGFHGGLAAARPESMAALLQNHVPAFSTAAANVKQHSNGVTSYDITPGLGPKFAYKVAAASNFSVPDAFGRPTSLSIVQLDIGPDRATGAKSDYSGKAFHIFGQGKQEPWAAELWDNCTANGVVADTAATLGHNNIVDGVFGINGFRGLANSALKAERANPDVPVRPNREPASITVTDGLLEFVADAKNIPGLTGPGRQVLLAQLRDLQQSSNELPDPQGLQAFAQGGRRTPVPLDSGARPAGTIASGPLAHHLLKDRDL